MGLRSRPTRLSRRTTVAAPVVVGMLAGVLLLLPLGPDGVGGVVRIVVGLPFVLVLPGYVLSRAVLPGTGASCSVLQRVCWTLALDMALLVVSALLLNVLPNGLTGTSWVVLLLLVLPVAGVVAHVRERGPGRARTVLLSRAWWPTIQWPAPRRLLIAGATVAIAGAAIGLALVSATTQPSPGFSQLWLQPQGPTTTAAPETAQLGVYSDEDATRQFRVEVRPDGEPTQTWSFSLDPGDSWQQSVDVPGDARTVALLFRGSDPTPYRQVWTSP
ncbi:DUF1616 domain-containing protein [Actinomycetospora endophytica]|uniref:DUF1616 domain-containing protein n=1 Tax=Actinomycetospora endophytica TaxID=2291215 RepID=A0ABS8PCY2_9PSEU|nr:DUF1616 domain-containing protein [Actinomycetospora endophytica]MCD2196098.1 DUF1616 domain-containing protein [Actinomycetospora endophytica]